MLRCMKPRAQEFRWRRFVAIPVSLQQRTGLSVVGYMSNLILLVILIV